MKQQLTLLAALLLAVSATFGQTEKHVLFVGNSYTQVNDLPSMVGTIADGMGDRLTYESNTPGGCTFSQHCQNQSMTLIRRGGWDAVILQEQSQYPAFPDGQVANEVFPYAQRLVDSVYANAPCAEPMFYMTWGRKYGDEMNATVFPPIGTYEGMDSLLALRYRMMADQNDAALCPVGRVWHYLRDSHPDIELYQSDNSHPSLAGTYAAACAFYTMLFLRNPEEIRYDATLEADIATTIRAAVRSVVFDSLSLWQRPQPQVEIAVADTLSYMQVSLALTTTHADSVSIRWGDGSDTLLAADGPQVIPHLYAAEGTYEIAVEASRHCMKAEGSLPFTAQQAPGDPVGIGTAEVRTLTLAPNPASRQIRLSHSEMIETIEILDLQGRQLLRHHPEACELTLPLPELAAGTYLVRVHTPSGTTTQQLVVNP